MNDIMIDMETADNTLSASILSFAAVRCDLITGKLGHYYYRVIDLDSCLDYNLSVSGGTIYWWLEQNEFARKSITEGVKLELSDFCLSFNRWIDDEFPNKAKAEKVRLWGNGASFDNAILRHAYKKANIEFNIPFWKDRDVRTLVGFYPSNLYQEWKSQNRVTGAHNPLIDCKHQIKYCSHILQELGVTELY